MGSTCAACHVGVHALNALLDYYLPPNSTDRDLITFLLTFPNQEVMGNSMRYTLIPAPPMQNTCQHLECLPPPSFHHQASGGTDGVDKYDRLD